MNDNFYLSHGLFNPNRKFFINFDTASNPHLSITGGSGSGKTRLGTSIINWFNERNKIIYVIDFKGDLKFDNETLFMYSKRNSPHSIGLFQFNLDVKNGGILSHIDIILRLLKKYYITSMGDVQKTVLRQLFIDTYAKKGFYEHDEKSWVQGLDLSDSHDAKIWASRLPTMEDLHDTLMSILDFALFQDEKDFAKAHTVFMKKLRAKQKSKFDFATAKSDLMNKYDELLTFAHLASEQEHIQDEILKDINMDFYLESNSIKALKSLSNYIKNLNTMGVFSSMPPTVSSGINRFDFSNLDSSVASMCVEFLVNTLTTSLNNRGEYNSLPIEYRRKHGDKFDHVFYIDEAQRVLPKGAEAKDSNYGFNKFVAEFRSKGGCMIVITQTPVNIPELMLTNIANKITFKCEDNDISKVNSLLGIPANLLSTLSTNPGTLALKEFGTYEIVQMPWQDMISTKQKQIINKDNYQEGSFGFDQRKFV